ncbi:MAG: ATP-binding protein [Elusimicrobiota bacterium]
MADDKIDRIEAELSAMKVLAELTARINAGHTLDEVLDHVYDSFRRLIPYDRIGVALLIDDGTVLRARWARAETQAIRLKQGFSAPMLGSSLQHIIDTGMPRILNDLEAYLREHPESSSTRLIVAEGIRSSLTCPLVVAGAPIGFIFFSSTERDTYRNAHVVFFQQLAGQLAMAVERGQLFQELVELGRLKDKFLGIAAHDLRHPLTVIMGYAEMIQQDVLGDDRAARDDALGKITDAAKMMNRVLEELLDVSTIQSGHLSLDPRPIDSGEFLRRTVAKYAMLGKKKSIAVSCAAADDLPGICADPERIDQVLSNLISNAVKFSHPNTQVKVTGERKSGEVRISVRDQGQGIPADALPQLFEEFGAVGVKPTAGEKSTGLGLAIVKKIVRAHGGRIWAESTPGKGSAFTFVLPLDASLSS